jgi:hypothetical protein
MELLVILGAIGLYELWRSKRGTTVGTPQSPFKPLSGAQPGGTGSAPAGLTARGGPVLPSGLVQDSLDNIGQAIANFEHINPAYNNPGAIKTPAANQFGPGLATGTTPAGFATFGDQGDGWDVLNNYITANASAHPDWNFYDFFQHYLGQSQGGPAVTNQGDSNAYADYVSQFLGVAPTQPVSSVLYGG